MYRCHQLGGETGCIFTQVDLKHVPEDRTSKGHAEVASYEPKERDGAGTNGNELGLLMTARGANSQSAKNVAHTDNRGTYNTY